MSGRRYTGRVSQPAAEPEHLPPATERQVRTRAAELVELAARHGITRLAYASRGRLRGHIGEDRDLFDMFEFQRDATELAGRRGSTVLRRRAGQRARQPRPGHRHAAVSSDTRPDRHALLELDALLDQVILLRDEGDAARFDKDDRYRWMLHRLWIAAGNEALAYTTATGQAVRADRTWANLYDLRNHLAHSRLPDIDEALVRRFTWTRLDALRDTTQHHLQTRP